MKRGLVSIKMKRGLVLIMVLFFIINSIYLIDSSKTASPLLVRGYVKESVLGNVIVDKNLEVVVKTSIGSMTIADTKFTEPEGKHEDGYYDAVVFAFPGDKVTVTATIKGTSCYGAKTEIAPGGTRVGLMNINVAICCTPSKPINLNPKISYHITQPTEVEFSWTLGKKGNVNYPDLWEDFIGFGNVNDAKSPLLLTIDTFKAWSVKTCNGIKGGEFCCSSAGVGGKTVNKPCPKPTNLKGAVQGGYVVTTWESSDIDEEGDNCHDVWEAVSLDMGESLEDVSWTGNAEPANREGELALAHATTFWKVKSCDELGACSDWAMDITPSCNQVSENCPDVQGIKTFMGGGKEIRIIEQVLDRKVIECFTDVTEIPVSKGKFNFLWIFLRLLVISGIVYYEYGWKKRKLKK